MTDNGDPYENAMAERVNGILEVDFKLNRLFKSPAEALMATRSAVVNYNLLRPHMSCDYLTPQTAHLLDQPMRMHWKKKKGSKQKQNYYIVSCQITSLRLSIPARTTFQMI